METTFQHHPKSPIFDASSRNADERELFRPALSQRRAYVKRESYTEAERQFIERNLKLLWPITVTAFEQGDWKCYYSMVDYLGSIVDGNLTTFKFDAMERLRKFFGLSGDREFRPTALTPGPLATGAWRAG
ncbi:hypothetical protein AAVH_26759 [Aphelenchoides avenae]|nr:hypothetical protein AAVH_26759 [Aphelenchus avenae]